MQRIVVTGGAGFVGSFLCESLLNRGHEVVAIDNCVTSSPKNLSAIENHERFEFLRHDVSKGLPDLGSVDALLHFASPASPKDFVPLAQEILKVGSYGTFAVAEYAEKHRAHMMLASTSEFYGDPLEHPQKESYLGNVNPNGVRGVYDEAKRFSEAVVSSFARTKGLETSIVRIFNTFGPRMRIDDGRIITNFIGQALKNKALTAHGDGLQTRSFCYVDDLVEGIVRCFERKVKGPINIGNGQERTVLDVADTIISLCESESKVEHHPMPQDDPKKRRPDITMAKELLDWEPKVSFKDGLAKTIAYFKENA